MCCQRMRLQHHETMWKYAIMTDALSALELLDDGPRDAPCRFLLAHGAGAPMTSPFLTGMAARLAQAGLSVTRFEFAYMAARRTEGRRRPPPKADRLIGEYKAAVNALRRRSGPTCRLVIGGKSLGGRVASLVAEELYREGAIAGLVCLGYPFHPPAKPEVWRTAHLDHLTCPTLIVQGERDPFGTRTEMAGQSFPGAIRFHWIADGDHDLAPRARSGTTHERNLDDATSAVERFIRSC